MDPTGLLDAVLAVSVYPGAVFVLVATVLHRGVAGRRPGGLPGGTVPLGVLVPVVAAIAAAAMLPLSGSPALHLPPPSGAAGNVLAVAVLLAIAVDRGAGNRLTCVLAVLAAVPVIALAAAAGTFSVEAIGAEGGATGITARALAAGCLLLAAAAPPAPGSRAGSVVRATLALAAAALTIPAAMGTAPAPLVAVLCLGVVALAAVVSRVAAAVRPLVTTGVAAAAALAGTVLALLSSRL